MRWPTKAQRDEMVGRTVDWVALEAKDAMCETCCTIVCTEVSIDCMLGAMQCSVERNALRMSDGRNRDGGESGGGWTDNACGGPTPCRDICTAPPRCVGCVECITVHRAACKLHLAAAQLHLFLVTITIFEKKKNLRAPAEWDEETTPTLSRSTSYASWQRLTRRPTQGQKHRRTFPDMPTRDELSSAAVQTFTFIAEPESEF